MSNVLAVGLFKHEPRRPSPKRFGQMYAFEMELFLALNTSPTYYGKSDGGTGKLKKFGTLSHHRRRVEKGFEGVDRVTLIANPAGSGEPGYDRYLNISFSYLDYGVPEDSHFLNWTQLFFEIDQGALPMSADTLKAVLTKLARVQPWDFGFGLIAPREKDPLLHVCSASNGKLSEEEYLRLNIWYGRAQAERLIKIRDVYPYNFLNPTQLAFPLSASATLRDFITSDPSSKLHSIAPDLELWEVEPEATEQVRAKLLGTGVLIAE